MVLKRNFKNTKNDEFYIENFNELITNWLSRNCTFFIVQIWFLYWNINSILPLWKINEIVWICILVLLETSINQFNFSQLWWFCTEGSGSRKSILEENAFKRFYIVLIDIYKKYDYDFPYSFMWEKTIDLIQYVLNKEAWIMWMWT